MTNERSPTQNEWNELDARLTKVYSLLCGGSPGEIREARDRLLEAQNLRAEMAIASRRSVVEPTADAKEDRAYYNGARQAAAMAHQSLGAMDEWINGGCGGRGPSVNRTAEPT